MRTINQQIKEAESTFCLVGVSVENDEKTITATETKLSMLGQTFTQQQRAVEKQHKEIASTLDEIAFGCFGLSLKELHKNRPCAGH